MSNKCPRCNTEYESHVEYCYNDGELLTKISVDEQLHTPIEEDVSEFIFEEPSEDSELWVPDHTQQTVDRYSLMEHTQSLGVLVVCFPNMFPIEISSYGPTKIGRDDPEDRVFIDYDGVTRKHCQIECRNGRWILEDLNSTNGTFIDDKHILPGQSYYLESGTKPSNLKAFNNTKKNIIELILTILC